MASWMGNRTMNIYRCRDDAAKECKRLGEWEEDGWSYTVRLFNEQKGWYAIQVRDETGEVLGDL